MTQPPFDCSPPGFHCSVSVTSAKSVRTVLAPINAHVVDKSSVYFQYGLILSSILNLWNKDISFSVEPHSICEICYSVQNITEQNVISERQRVCRSLCALMLHSHLTDFLRLWQHFFWGFSSGTTVPPNVTSTGKSQTGTIRCRGSSSRWLSFDWLYNAVCVSWNFPPSTCGHICDWISILLARQNVYQCLH